MKLSGVDASFASAEAAVAGGDQSGDSTDTGLGVCGDAPSDTNAEKLRTSAVISATIEASGTSDQKSLRVLAASSAEGRNSGSSESRLARKSAKLGHSADKIFRAAKLSMPAGAGSPVASSNSTAPSARTSPLGLGSEAHSSEVAYDEARGALPSCGGCADRRTPTSSNLIPPRAVAMTLRGHRPPCTNGGESP